jgi:hypothetical protein
LRVVFDKRLAKTNEELSERIIAQEIDKENTLDALPEEYNEEA